MKYKFLAFLTAVVLVFGITPAGITRATEDAADSRTVKLLSALGIMDADSHTGKFWDNTPVERQEMAKILCNLFDLEVSTDTLPRFNDVHEDYRAHVETAVRNGYMSGYNKDEFGAKDYITCEQLVKIFVSVLGADKPAETSGGFPNGYIYIARRIGLLNGMTLDFNGNAKRIDVANIIYSAMHTDVTELVGMSGEKEIYNISEGETFLTERLKIYCFEGIVEQNEVTTLDSPKGAGVDNVRIGDTIFKDPKHILEDSLGYSLTIYVHKPSETEPGEIVYTEEKNNNNVLVIDDDDFIDAERYNINYYSGDKKRTFKLSSVVHMIYNGKAIEYDANRLYVKNGYTKYIDNNNDDAYDVINIYDYDTFVVGGVNTDNMTITLKFGEGNLKLENNFSRIFCEGKEYELKNIAVGSVILVAASDDEENDSDRAFRIQVSTEKIMGKIEKIFSKDGFRCVTIKGNDYKIGEYCEKLIKNNKIEDISPNASGQLFMDERGNVAYAMLNDSGVSAGYLIGSAFEKTPFSAILKSKIYTTDGKIEIFTTSDTVIIDDIKRSVSEFADDYSVVAKLKSPQLVLYSISNGILKEIDFPENGYDDKKFSMDVTGVYKCTRPSIIDNKYIVPSSTQVFYVPSLSASADNYETYMNNPSNYAIYGGGHFSAGNYFGLSLYDINEDGEARYAVSKKDPTTGNITEGNQSLVVTAIGDGVNKNNEVVTMIWGLNENGEEIVLSAAEADQITDKVLNREAKFGDVIQYYTNSDGELLQIQIQHDIDSGNYYTPRAYESTKADYSVTKVYGEVLSTNGSSLHLCCEPINAAMTVMDSDMYVADTGKAIYRVDTSNGKIYKATFDEIEKGDKVFACVNRQNYTRILVIYN